MTDENKPKEEEAAESGARERVKRHLRKILTTAAMAGLGATATACDETIVCDPLPPPDSGWAGGDPRSGDPSGDPAGGERQGEAEPGDPEGDGDGMVVCDPLPPPDGGDQD